MNESVHASRRTCLALFIICFASWTFADTTDAKTEVAIGITAIGRNESNAYGNIRVTRQLNANDRVEFVSTLGSRKRFVGTGFAIRYGGSDYEARYGRSFLGGADLKVGLALANTPSGRNAPYLTLNGSAPIVNNEHFGVDVVGRSAARSKSSLVGAGIHTEYRTHGLSAFAEGLWVTGSSNSYNTRGGSAQRRAVYRFGVRPKTSDKLKIELGVTNQMGRTTGTSLTPGLGRGLGGYFEMSVKF
jgi:hypothetical protein